MTEKNHTLRTTDSREEASLLPPVNVLEDTQGIILTADLPGVPKDKLDIHVEGDTLIIEGQVVLNIPEKMEATHTEISLPRYRRIFTLSKELDSEKVSAQFQHGVLTLRIPRAEHAQPRKIDVRVS